MSKTIEKCDESGFRIEQDEFPKWECLAGQPRYSVVSKFGEAFYVTNDLHRAQGYLEATRMFKRGLDEEKNVYHDPHLGECLYGDSYGEEGHELGKISSAINKANGWGFFDEELNLYKAAFGYMRNGASVATVLKCLPEAMDMEGLDEDEKKTVTRLLLILNANPHLIRAYIIERLEDANFHSEARELLASVKGDSEGDGGNAEDEGEDK